MCWEILEVEVIWIIFQKPENFQGEWRLLGQILPMLSSGQNYFVCKRKSLGLCDVLAPSAGHHWNYSLPVTLLSSSVQSSLSCPPAVSFITISDNKIMLYTTWKSQLLCLLHSGLVPRLLLTKPVKHKQILCSFLSRQERTPGQPQADFS